MISTVIYNMLMVGADVAALGWLRKHPRPVSLVLTVAGAQAVACVLALTLGEDNFGALRLLAYGIFGHGVVLLGGGAWIVRRSLPKTGAVSLGLMALVVGIGVDAFLVEPRWLEVNRVVFHSDQIERPLTIALIADLQTDRIGNYERDVLARVRAERPDLILLAGDYLHENDIERYHRARDELRDLWRELAFDPPLGAYAVKGNAEHSNWTQIFHGLPVTCLEQTESVRISDLTLTGLSLTDSFDPRLHVEARDGFHIVLGHAPDYALGEVNADLLLAGHTHGGQVRIPFFGPPITLSRVPRSWAAGKTDLGNGRHLFVSRGIGLERGHAPRIRFFCRPELVFIDLLPEKVGESR